MAFLIFQDQAAATRIVAEIEVTANIEGGVGPVKLGTLAPLSGGRWVAAHPFAAVDLDWIAIYAGDAGLEIAEQLP